MIKFNLPKLLLFVVLCHIFFHVIAKSTLRMRNGKDNIEDVPNGLDTFNSPSKENESTNPADVLNTILELVDRLRLKKPTGANAEEQSQDDGLTEFVKTLDSEKKRQLSGLIQTVLLNSAATVSRVVDRENKLEDFLLDENIRRNIPAGGKDNRPEELPSPEQRHLPEELLKQILNENVDFTKSKLSADDLKEQMVAGRKSELEKDPKLNAGIDNFIENLRLNNLRLYHFA